MPLSLQERLFIERLETQIQQLEQTSGEPSLESCSTKELIDTLKAARTIFLDSVHLKREAEPQNTAFYARSGLVLLEKSTEEELPYAISARELAFIYPNISDEPIELILLERDLLATHARIALLATVNSEFPSMEQVRPFMTSHTESEKNPTHLLVRNPEGKYGCYYFDVSDTLSYQPLHDPSDDKFNLSPFSIWLPAALRNLFYHEKRQEIPPASAEKIISYEALSPEISGILRWRGIPLNAQKRSELTQRHSTALKSASQGKRIDIGSYENFAPYMVQEAIKTPSDDSVYNAVSRGSDISQELSSHFPDHFLKMDKTASISSDNSGTERILIISRLAPASLSAFCKTQTLSPELRLEFAIQLADIMRKMHELSINHNDFKDDNIVVFAGNRLKAIDFDNSTIIPDLVYGACTYRCMSPQLLALFIHLPAEDLAEINPENQFYRTVKDNRSQFLEEQLDWEEDPDKFSADFEAEGRPFAPAHSDDAWALGLAIYKLYTHKEFSSLPGDPLQDPLFVQQSEEIQTIVRGLLEYRQADRWTAQRAFEALSGLNLSHQEVAEPISSGLLSGFNRLQAISAAPTAVNEPQQMPPSTSTGVKKHGPS